MRRLLLPLLAIATLLFATRADARPIDTVSVIRSASGIPYVCCYTFFITNRHTDTTIRIQEVRMRLIAGPASFEEGNSNPPIGWSLIGQTLREVIFYSNAANRDILPGDTVGTFNVCVRDSGIFRMVWETYSIDSLLSRDTLVYACHGEDCDESFFRVQPSNIAPVVAMDVVNGNLSHDVVNDFHIHPLGAARFNITAPILAAPGWTRTRTRNDTIIWETASRALLTREDFAEGFRVTINNVPRDSSYRLEWWTTNFGQMLCRDTATLRWGLTRRDSVRMLTTPDNCCRNLRVRNIHLPTSPITRVAVRTTTPGARVAGTPTLPSGWTSTTNTARDSMTLTLPAGLQFDSAAVFGGICVDNAGLSSDSVQLRVYTWSQDVPLDTSSFLIICPRPLTRCDSVWVERLDSSENATRRCVTIALQNLNSRTLALQKLTLRFTNPGARRRVVDAQAPPGWNLGSFGGDSATFVNGQQLPNEISSGFNVCLDNNDTTAADPVSMTWTTGDDNGEICRGVVTFNATFRAPVVRCDSVWLTSVPSDSAATSCFKFHLANFNTDAQTVTSLGLAVDFSTNTAFNGADADAPWTADYGGAFPSFGIAYTGGTIVPNAIDSSFLFCLDTRLLQSLPTNVPIRWSTFNGSTLLCTGIVQATIEEVVQPADSDHVILLGRSDGDGFCGYDFGLQNVHIPASSVDAVGVTIESGTGRIKSAVAHGAGAAGWNTTQTVSDSVAFTGGVLASGTQLDTLTINIDSSDGLPVTLRFDSYNGGTLVSQRRVAVECSVSGVVEIPVAGITLALPRPNPARDRVSFPFTLTAPARVSLTLSSGDGRVVRVAPAELFPAGAQSIELNVADLPAGVYYATVDGGGMRAVRSVVLLR